MKDVLKTLEFDKVREMLAKRTASTMGRELAENLIPSNDYDIVTDMLAETDEARQAAAIKPNVPLGGIRDIRVVIKRARLEAVLEPHELLAVSSSLYAARRMKNYFLDLTTMVLLPALADKITALPRLENVIDNTVNEQGVILDDASVQLYDIRRQIRLLQTRIKDKLDSILRSTEYQKYFQDSLITIRSDRYVVPIKQEARQFFPGIVHDQSSSGATVFIEPMAIVNMNNDVKQFMAAEKEEIERILRRITEQIRAVADVIDYNSEMLARLDLAFAKAKLAVDMKAERPFINKEGDLRLDKARHPLINAQVVVPIDIRLAADYQILLITGPNTGGKTVTLKTVGLFALMTQAGLFVPAESGCRIPVYRQIFADIGDEQSIEQSLSTFSAHMSHLVRILAATTRQDLVLIDEIGAGTDPSEGAALAMAILDHLRLVGTSTIVTTHYSELKSYAYSHDGIENASVEFDMESLRPTYRLLIGVPGSSNAFYISHKLGLSIDIVNNARRFLDKDYVEFETVLSELEEEKRLFRQKNEELQRFEADYVKKAAALHKDVESVEERKKVIMGKAKAESAEILRRSRREAEELIAQLKRQFDQSSGKEVTQNINRIRREISDALYKVTEYEESHYSKDKIPDKDELKIGDLVFIISINSEGEVVSINGNEVTVQLGMMKINVPVSKCRSVGKAKDNKSPTKNTFSHTAKMTSVSRQIDIRGMTVEEAEPVLDKFLDDALLSGLSDVLVIHGKGTGALRKGVRQFLQNHSAVKQTEIAELNEGGDGATVVKM